MCLTARPAEAKTPHESPYTYEQTYGSTLRLVKVDLALTVTDHDPDWGYLLFEYTSRESGGRKSRGSFEFVRKRSNTRVSLQLASMPSYHERMLIEKLRQKLTAEHGSPPAPKPAKRSDKKRKGDDDSASKKKRSQGEARKNKANPQPSSS